MIPGVGQQYESLADRIVRIVSSLKEIPTREIVDGVIAHDPLAVGLAGALGVSEAVPELSRQLKDAHSSAFDYNKLLIALDELNVKELAPYIEAHFLQGQTRAAATIALMRMAPERAVSGFTHYVKHCEEGGRVIALGLRQLAEKDRPAMLNVLQYIPSVLVKSALPHLTEDVKKEIAPYT